MTTVVLAGLTVVLVLAAVYVGFLLLRASRADRSTDDMPRTVADLVRLRAGPADLSGSELFTPAGGRSRVPAAGAPRDAADAAGGTVEADDPVPVPAGQASDDGEAAERGGRRAEGAGRPVTPAEGIEVGDAPWRRAARMMGTEPGARWDTAPTPVVTPETVRPGTGSVPAVARLASPAPAPAAAPPAPALAWLAPPTASGSSTRAPSAGPLPAGPPPAGPPPESGGPEPTPAAPEPTDAAAGMRDEAPADGEPADREPVDAVAEPPASVPAPPAPSGGVPAAEVPSVERPETPAAAAADVPAPSGPVAVSRPLSDPDLTPLMGIPLIRPGGAGDAAFAAALDGDRFGVPGDGGRSGAPHGDDGPVPAHRRTTGVPSRRFGQPARLPVPVPAPSRRVTAARDDVVVSLLPADGTAPLPVIATGSPQPVWFRVVRRDGEPVADTVVALLDDRGREVDTTKAAADGGGELRSPHGGRFLLIAAADGFQPRAATLTVDERPVEIALLLPRSATVAGAVLDAGSPVAGARVVAAQEGEVVDETMTSPDGGYRFDDLAEGPYALSAAGPCGRAVLRVTVPEGADLRVDLDLVRREGAG